MSAISSSWPAPSAMRRIKLSARADSTTSPPISKICASTQMCYLIDLKCIVGDLMIVRQLSFSSKMWKHLWLSRIVAFLCLNIGLKLGLWKQIFCEPSHVCHNHDYELVGKLPYKHKVHEKVSSSPCFEIFGIFDRQILSPCHNASNIKEDTSQKDSWRVLAKKS